MAAAVVSLVVLLLVSLCGKARARFSGCSQLDLPSEEDDGDNFLFLQKDSASSCIVVNINENRNLTVPWRINGTANFTLRGNGNTITCSSRQQGAGIVLDGVSEVTLENVRFVNCGVIDDDNDASAAVTIRNSVQLNVLNCEFVQSLGIGLVTLYETNTSTTADIVIADSVFKENHNLLYYLDYNCDYLLSNRYSRTSLMFELNGGGLNVDLRGLSQATLTITNCSFINNCGWIGGGAYINTDSFSKSINVLLEDCTFFSNTAGLLGGGLHIGAIDSISSIPKQLNLNIIINKAIFADNLASHAAGLSYQTGGQTSSTLPLPIVNFTRISFVHNTASLSGLAIGLFKWEPGIGGHTAVVNFHNCSWEDNLLYHNQANTSIIVGIGTIYTIGISIQFTGTTLLARNHGTAIFASGVQIFFHDQVAVSSNKGVRGGAISLVDGSRMVVHSGLNLTFINNYADFGGAVYHVFPAFGVTGENFYCVFVYYQQNVTNPTYWDANITFINNFALISGSSIYLSSPDSCMLDEKNEIFTEQSVFRFIPSYDNQISTSPVVLKFESPSIDCSTDEVCTAEVMLGEKLTLSVKAIDSFGNVVNGFAVVDISCVLDNGTMVSSPHCSKYKVNGNNLVRVNDQLQQIGFYLTGKYNLDNGNGSVNDTIVLSWQLIEIPAAVAYLNVRIKRCNLGYVYDESLQMCVCYSSLSEQVVTCGGANYSTCIRFGHWYGMFDDSFVSSDCTFGSCNYRVSGQCPKGKCQLQENGLQFYCELPQDDPDKLCLFNKGGVLCSKCKEGYSATFDNIQCIPERQCHVEYAVLQAALYILYLVVAILLVLLVARYDLRIGSGQIYGLVFYFSIFKEFVGGLFPSTFLYVVELIFTGIVQFNPEILGMLPICSGLKIDPFTAKSIHLINPIILGFTIFLIIYISWRWPKYAILQNSRSGINAICIMLYISFISITQTSLTILTPIKFRNAEGVYTYLDPTVKYFSGVHIFYALLSIVLQLLLVTPFLCLLLFSPFLIKVKKLNLTRIKPILDEFQACYKEKYRYFAGFYLLCRQLIFLISFINLGAFAYIYILQFFSTIMLTIHLMIQPYTNKLLNILDALLILNLVLLSLLHGNTAAVVFSEVIEFKIALIYLLVLLPVLYFVVLCFYPAINRLLPTRVKDKRLKMFHVKKSSNPCTVRSRHHSTTLLEDPRCIDSMMVTADDANMSNRPSNNVRAIAREPLLFLDSYSCEYVRDTQK